MRGCGIAEGCGYFRNGSVRPAQQFDRATAAHDIRQSAEVVPPGSAPAGGCERCCRARGRRSRSTLSSIARLGLGQAALQNPQKPDDPINRRVQIFNIGTLKPMPAAQ